MTEEKRRRMKMGYEKETAKSVWTADRRDGTYRNPILYADYSDLDAIRVGEDYFMIASSFCNTPAIPVLHSRDLVNWKVINYVAENIPLPGYDVPRHGCGVWAPAIRYHEGVYYVLVPFPDEGIMVSRTTDPWGSWSRLEYIKKVTGWIDPCPFWDEDGKAYMVSAFAKSRIGLGSWLYLSPMKEDCSELTGEGKFIYDGHKTQPTIEGPKLYKRNGYYYIFAPAGGVTNGWQTVLRSRNIEGPYEERIVLHQGKTSVNGPHQGAWVETPNGESWFLHFQEAGNAGRVIHLQPMRWEEDWPVIGENQDESGCGEPVPFYRKPDVGGEYPVETPDTDDDFQNGRPGLQWQWNANHREEWYACGNGSLKLYAQKTGMRVKLCDVANLLLQKWPGPEFAVSVLLLLDEWEEGDIGGLVTLGGHYSALMLERKDGKMLLQQWSGIWNEGEESHEYLEEISGNRLYIRLMVKETKTVSYQISEEGKEFRTVGRSEVVTPGKWVGVKTGLGAVHPGNGKTGALKAAFFHIDPLCR